MNILTVDLKPSLLIPASRCDDQRLASGTGRRRLSDVLDVGVKESVIQLSVAVGVLALFAIIVSVTYRGDNWLLVAALLVALGWSCRAHRAT